ncbi:hypothetical protein [Chlamydiifrater volucris]|nr:hypothetical protein [Chlamydiifrater volucris]
MANFFGLGIRDNEGRPPSLEDEFIPFSVKVPLPERDKAKRLSYLVRDLVLFSSFLMILLTFSVVVSGVFLLGMWTSLGISFVLTTVLIGMVVWSVHKCFRSFTRGLDEKS